MHLCGKMDKIRYRLVYNRQNTLNRQGTALVQVEAYLNQRKIYLKTNVYLKPECWSREGAQVINHPQSNELNTMLYEYILYLQGIELGYWKRGIPATLSLLKDAVKKKSTVNVSFSTFAKSAIDNSDKKQSTKDNLHSTLAVLAINQGYMHADAYPFRKYKIKQEKGRHEFLTPDELKKLETVEVEEESMRHVLDAFLFCCYTGLRYSDFCQLTPENFIRVNGKRWLYFKSVKTGVEIRLPLHLLFESRALGILDRYPDIGSFAALPCNSEVNKQLRKLAGLCGIKKRITYHVSRHTCATLLVHQGVAITTVQKLLGHTSVKTTQIYSEVLSSTIVRDLKNVQRKRKKVKMFPDKGLRTSDFIDNR